MHDVHCTYVVNRTRFPAKLVDWLLIALWKWEYAEFSRNNSLVWWLEWPIKLTIYLVVCFISFFRCVNISEAAFMIITVCPCIILFARTHTLARTRAFTQINMPLFPRRRHLFNWFFRLIAFVSVSLLHGCSFKCEISFGHVITTTIYAMAEPNRVDTVSKKSFGHWLIDWLIDRMI